VANLTMLVGARIRQFRKKLNMTQEQLGELAQLQSSYIGGVERGDRNVSLETLEKIIKAFNISFSEFFQFGEIGTTKRLQKAELIEVFTGELLSKDIDDIRKIFEIYNVIYKLK
jgi:transcriptional regulator with XRE-family HTH domain